MEIQQFGIDFKTVVATAAAAEEVVTGYERTLIEKIIEKKNQKMKTFSKSFEGIIIP